MGQNLTGQTIASTYEDLVQISGSILTDGTGSNINSLTITASFATQALNASTATIATTATSASQATNANNAISASYALTASFALNGGGGTVNTGSLLVTASISNATTTFTKGDGSTFALVTNNVQNASSASIATSASFATNATSASFATNALASQTAVSASHALNANNSISASFATNASTATSASFAQTASFALNVTPINTGSFYVSSSVTNATITFNQGDGTTETVTVNNVSNASTASIATSASFATNASTATSASFATNAATASFLPSTTNLNITSISASNAIFQSASIGYLQTVSGSVTIIGDAFILLNTSDVTRYAGILVEDSGSATPTNFTASFQFDSQLNDWFYEYSGSDPTNFGVAMFGPEYTTKGSPTYLTNNRIPKGNGGHHLNDSNITDNGTTVSISTPLVVTGSINATSFTGSLLGTASYAVQALSASFAPSTPAFPFTGNAQINGNLSVTGSYLRRSGSFSGSLIDNITDVYTTSPVIEHVVSLTQAQYNTISGSADPNTLYYITDAAGVPIPSLQEVTSVGATTSASVSITDGANLMVDNQTGNADLIVTSDGSNTYNSTIRLGGGSGGGGNGFYLEMLPGDIANLRSDGGLITLNNNTQVTGSLNVTAGITGSLQGTASFATTASFFSLAAVTQNAVFSGSVRGEVNALTISSNTASLNCALDNFFTLQLVSGSNTFINPSNILPGQTINLRVNTTGSATVSFPSSVKQVSGSAYVPTTTTGVDVVTFISFDATSLLLSNVKNLV